METIKTKLIHDSTQAVPKYRGLVHGVATMVREGGIASIYKGLAPTMAKQGTNQAVRFTVFSFIKDHYLGWQSQRQGKTVANFNLFEALAAGAVAGGVSVYATMPFDVVKTVQQGLNASNSSFSCMSSIVRNEGVLALWKGTTPRLGRVCFSGGIIFAVYEQLLKVLLAKIPDEE
jgi:solute carrier family 25 citrate transporter 1